MSLVSRLINLDNPAFNGYITYGSVLVLKMMIMSPLTGRQRMKHGVSGISIKFKHLVFLDIFLDIKGINYNNYLF